MPRGTCLECDAEVDLRTDDDLCDIVKCSECGTELEIAGLDPVEFILPDDEDDDDEEDF